MKFKKIIKPRIANKILKKKLLEDLYYLTWSATVIKTARYWQKYKTEQYSWMGNSEIDPHK